TLMTRETGTKIIGLCHGHYGVDAICNLLGLDMGRVTWSAPGLNHQIWLNHFLYNGEDAYPILDEWIATQGEAYWRDHRAEKTREQQVPIIDALTNNTGGFFQVNVPNQGVVPGIPDDVVAEMSAWIDATGIHGVRPTPLPRKIMLEQTWPAIIEMERELEAF